MHGRNNPAHPSTRRRGPPQEFTFTDQKLRAFLTDHVDKSPEEIRKLAKETFQIEISPPAGGGGWF